MPKQYFVNLTHRGETYTREWNPNTTFEELCADVWSGQIEDFVDIIEVDLEAGTARDCQADIARVLSERSFRDGEPYHEIVDLIEAHKLPVFRNKPSRRELAYQAPFYRLVGRTA